MNSRFPENSFKEALQTKTADNKINGFLIDSSTGFKAFEKNREQIINCFEVFKALGHSFIFVSTVYNI